MKQVKEIISKYKDVGASEIHITDVAKIIELLQEDKERYAQQRVNEVLDRASLDITEKWNEYQRGASLYENGVLDRLDLAEQITDKLKNDEK